MINYLKRFVLMAGGDSGGGGGGGGGGDGGYAERQKEEEAKKAALRTKMNKFFGIADSAATKVAPTREQFMRGGGYGPQQWGQYGDPIEPTFEAPTFDEAGYNAALASYDPNAPADPEAAAAAASIAANREKIRQATEGYHTQELRLAKEKADRAALHRRARQGLTGSSVEGDDSRELNTDFNKGLTRISDEASQAALGYDNALENSRLQAEQLINAGGGEDAVAGAARAQALALQNAQNRQKADLTGGLFSDFAQNAAAGQAGGNAALAAALLNKRIKSFYNPLDTPGAGRVTST